MSILRCAGTPIFDYDPSQSWPIYGPTIQFATYNFVDQVLLAIYEDRTYVIVLGVGMFTALDANEANVLRLISSNPTVCSLGSTPILNVEVLLDSDNNPLLDSDGHPLTE